MNIDLRHLQILVAVADAGSIRGAATRLRLAQPSLTRQLHRIETALGGAVFDRTPHGVVPTATGTKTLDQARRVLADLDRMWTGAAEILHQLPSRPARVGGVVGAFTDALVPASEAVGDAPVTSHGDPMVSRLVDQLAAGQLDAAVLHEFPGFTLRLPPSLGTRHLITEPIFVGVAEEHPLAQRSELDLAELAPRTWALPRDDDGGLHASFHRACADAGFTARVRHWTTDSAAVAPLVAAGAVCGLYPTTYVLPGMRAMPLAGAPLRRRVLLAWRRDSFVHDRTEEFVAHLYRSYAAIVRHRPAYRDWWAAHATHASPGLPS
ncbi:LysR family transcriptional regulator [Longispora sp. NPDC051575]|uniref:LysR family transcriptional regulator n=1 Tax=Longispora sp. NPDC051575 TaxID=3154943 RepID=UPI0034475501